MNLPVGSIILWAEAVIPEGWQVCDGTNGTPDLVGRFPRGASSDSDLLTTGGSATHVHGNGSTSSGGAHTHAGISGTTGVSSTSNVYAGPEGPAAQPHTHNYSASVQSGGEHSHAIGNTGAASSMPPYKTLVYIMRVV